MTGMRFVSILLLALASAPSLHAAQPAPAGHVIIMGQLTLKPGREADFRTLIAEMGARTRREDHGNLRYDFYTATPMQGGATTWVFVEEWQDQASALAHQKWAGPLVMSEWRALSDSMEFKRLELVNLPAP